MSNLAKAAQAVLGHDRFTIIDEVVTLDDTELPVDANVQNEIDNYQVPTYNNADQAIAAMKGWIERAEEQIDGGVSEGERNSYSFKEAEARAWMADNSVSTPILSAEAAVTGENLSDLIVKVTTKADRLRPILGQIAGLRRSVEITLRAEEAKPDFDPNKLETILDSAITAAIALAATHNIALSP